MKKLKGLLAGLLVVPVVSVSSAVVAGAQTLQEGVDSAEGVGAASGDSLDPGGLVTTIVNWALWFVGVLSVIMLIWGGIRYATSAGDSNKVTAAKNTILYAVIGLVVAIFAYAIVNFVITNVN